MTNSVLSAILARRTAGAKRLIEPGPSRAELETIIAAGAAAPDHGLLVPFRFVEVPRSRRADISAAFVAALHEGPKPPSADDIAKAQAKGERGPLLIAVIAGVKPDHPKITASDQWLTVGCVLQNMVLACEALDFGVGISSGRALASHAMRKLFALKDNEEVVSFLLIGKVTGEAAPPRRKPPLAEVLSTLT